jgi:hypothetical protein
VSREHRRCGARRHATGLAVALLVVLAGPLTPALADEGHAPPVAPTGAQASEATTLTVTLEELELQAEELRQQVRQQQAALAAERVRLTSAQTAAAAALEDYQLAAREADAATQRAAEEARRLAAAEQRTISARAALNAYVGTLYRQGMGSQTMSAYTSVLGAQGPEDFIYGLGLAERVGAHHGGEMVQLAAAEEAQQVAAQRAHEAQQAAREATERAAAAKQLADRVVTASQASVLRSTESLLRTQGAAAAVSQQEATRQALMAQAEEVARRRAGLPYVSADGTAIPRPAAECRGGSTRGYPNGMLSARALCPLWGTSGHMLRADAAAAFNEMSRDYASVFGTPICVTDSYRTFDEQVAVKLAKPDLAAQPGSSNHGWALAVDLCDGVESFGTAAHDWLRRNSLRYGWFLPTWAMPGGSKPEPWHWEYAG